MPFVSVDMHIVMEILKLKIILKCYLIACRPQAEITAQLPAQMAEDDEMEL